MIFTKIKSHFYFRCEVTDAHYVLYYVQLPQSWNSIWLYTQERRGLNVKSVGNGLHSREVWTDTETLYTMFNRLWNKIFKYKRFFFERGWGGFLVNFYWFRLNLIIFRNPRTLVDTVESYSVPRAACASMLLCIPESVTMFVADVEKHTLIEVGCGSTLLRQDVVQTSQMFNDNILNKMT